MNNGKTIRLENLPIQEWRRLGEKGRSLTIRSSKNMPNWMDDL